MQTQINDKYIAVVLCAGFGTRLRPLTQFMPKVVCPLINKPFAFYNIEKFFKAGFHTVHCNVHYLSEVVKNELLSACEFFGYDPARLRFWQEDAILETGGGIARIYHELCAEDKTNLKKDVIVVSGDIVADFPLGEMMRRWQKRNDNELALMCTKNLRTPRKDAAFVSDDLSHVVGFGEKFFKENSHLNIVPKLFSNHQIIKGEFISLCPVVAQSSVELFYRKMIAQKSRVINFEYADSLYWFNIGTPEEYSEAVDYFTKQSLSNEKINLAFEIPVQLLEALTACRKDECVDERTNLIHTQHNKILVGFRSTRKENSAQKIYSLAKISGDEKSNSSFCLSF